MSVRSRYGTVQAKLLAESMPSGFFHVAIDCPGYARVRNEEVLGYRPVDQMPGSHRLQRWLEVPQRRSPGHPRMWRMGGIAIGLLPRPEWPRLPRDQGGWGVAPRIQG